MARGLFVSARQRILILNTERAKPVQTIDQRGGDMDSSDIEKWRVKLDSYAMWKTALSIGSHAI